ncbi:lys-63-specific deubiquitinase BRCC36 [Hyalella azteca]|uniref:Lys-63-specific deubiquitinase BRCC36 n=1 Tax=Hyalella azteca TaxID=294128 RepID=A0A8B7NMD3_HYAAZ|nr:lys-63-specific deubiquitinase BRCC36 [Hyalella azteca]
MHKVSEVVLSHDVYMVCRQHAYTTDAEEVMGLLVGSYIQSESDKEKNEQNVTCDVIHAVILPRSDKRKDRVKISPEMLIQGQQKAEEISKTSKTRVNVVGWYHSHPKTTAVPSTIGKKFKPVDIEKLFKFCLLIFTLCYDLKVF